MLNFSTLETYETKYKIMEKIGGIFYVKFYRAIEEGSNKEVTLKVEDNVSSSMELEDTIFDETRFLIKTNRIPGIVKHLGYCFFNGPKNSISDQKTIQITKQNINVYETTSIIIVTDYMKNGCLDTLVSDYLKSGKSNEKINPTIRSKAIFGVSAIMKHLHEIDYIHRNLCIENVYLDENLEPSIAGHGIEDYFESNHYQHHIGYYDKYWLNTDSPGDYKYTKESDVLAFAFFLYKMFSNNRFSVNRYRSHRYGSHRSDLNFRPPKPYNIPDCYWELIQKCWNTNENERLSFEEITEILKSDKFALEEFGVKTDLDDLHNYQNKIDNYNYIDDDDDDEENEEEEKKIDFLIF